MYALRSHTAAAGVYTQVYNTGYIALFLRGAFQEYLVIGGPFDAERTMVHTARKDAATINI